MGCDDRYRIDLSLCSACFLRASALRANRLEGVRVGADRTLPGALVRHVNALSVAISCLAYGHCRGYTSLRSVDQALYDGGLSYGKTGADPNAFHDANLINKALKRAASLPAPGTGVDAMGPHEKGLAFFYVESPDLNAVHSSRYLPLLAIVPGLHLLMLFERGYVTPFQTVIGAGQAGVLFLVMFSRLSGLWMLAGQAVSCLLCSPGAAL